VELRSTSDSNLRITWREAVLVGLAPDGGLYLPSHLPLFSPDELEELATLPFPEFAFNVARHFLEDEISAEILRNICLEAFDFACPLHQLDINTYILELFHGPTCAFKDFGARFMSRLFRHFCGRANRRLTVLVATSGDTGSAVANAFFDATPDPSISVVILFPKGKVSLVQRKQMTTLGHNITALEVSGTFDDCQALAKEALCDSHLAESIALTSANSINIARLLPQMFYYAYTTLRFPSGTPLRYSVPSGNLGNLTGGLLAHWSGWSTTRFIAACNSNKTFSDFIKTGVFTPSSSLETISNAMDVGNPSNFYRISSLYNNDLDSLRSTLVGHSIDDVETRAIMKQVYSDYDYILDPHTAVGVAALFRERKRAPESCIDVVLATAHPAKFSTVVEGTLGVSPTLPPQLHDTLAKEEESISISTRYEELKTFLLR